MKSAEQKSQWGVGGAVWVEVQKAGPSWWKWEKEPQSGEATNDRAHAHTSTERWNPQILPIYNHKLHCVWPNHLCSRRWKHFNIKSTGTCTVSCHFLQSETNVSRVTTAWAQKLIQLNTRTVWRDNRGKGNPNYQRERTVFPLGNQDLQWKRRARVRLPGTYYSQLASKPWTVTKAVHWELQPVLRVVKDTHRWDMYRYLYMSARPGSWLTWWLGVKAALETPALANDWL